MATPLYVTGWEHQAPINTNGSSLYSLVLGTWTIDTSIKHTGNASVKVAVASSTAADIRMTKGIGSGTVINLSVYVNFGASLPGGSTIVQLLGAVNSPASNFPSVGYDPTTGFFVARIGTLSPQSDNVTVQTNTWYRIDFLSQITGGGTNQTLDIKIDGRTVAQSSAATTTTSYASVFLGTTRTDHTVAFNVYYDDLIYNATAADFPLSGGNNYGVEVLSPTSDGTHVAGTNVMEDQAGNDINGTTVTAYNKINSIPPDSTAYIKQSANGTGNYAEVLFGDIQSSHTSILGAMATLAYTSASTVSNLGGCIVSKDNFSSYTEVHGNPTTQQKMGDGSTANLFYKSAVISGVVDDTTVNALKARMGYSGDANPVPYWVDLVVEVAYVSSASTIIDLALVTCMCTFNDITVTAQEFTDLDLVTYPNTFNDITVTQQDYTDLDLVTYPNTFNDITTVSNDVVNLDLVSYPNTFNDITVTAQEFIDLDLVSYSSTENDITVVASDFTDLDLVTYSSTLNDITMVSNDLSDLDLVSYTNSINDITTVASDFSDLDVSSYSSSFPDITVIENEVVNLDLVSYSSSINDIFTGESDFTDLDLVSYAVSFNDITVVENEAVVLDLVSFSSTFNDLDTVSNDITALDLVSFSVAVNDISVTEQESTDLALVLFGSEIFDASFDSPYSDFVSPGERIYSVSRESRLLVIEKEDRVYTILLENRIITILN